MGDAAVADKRGYNSIKATNPIAVKTSEMTARVRPILLGLEEAARLRDDILCGFLCFDLRFIFVPGEWLTLWFSLSFQLTGQHAG